MLVERARSFATAGDVAAEAAFTELVERHRRSVVELVRRRTGSASAADEIATDAIAQAWGSLDDLADPERFRPWLLRIAARLIVDRWRSDARRNDRELRADRADRRLRHIDDPAEVAAAGSHDTETIRRALDRLGATHQEVIMLRFHADLSPAEAAEALGISPSAAGVRLHRAVAALRRQLDEDRHD